MSKFVRIHDEWNEEGKEILLNVDHILTVQKQKDEECDSMIIATVSGDMFEVSRQNEIAKIEQFIDEA